MQYIYYNNTHTHTHSKQSESFDTLVKEIHAFVGTGFTITAVRKALRASNGDKDDAIALLFDEDDGSMCDHFCFIIIIIIIIMLINNYY